MIDIIRDYGHTFLLPAMGKTLLLSLYGLLFACVIGLIFGMLSVLRNKACRIIARIFVDVIRGIPLIVLAFFIFFGLPYGFNNILNIKFTISALDAGIASLALNCGAYMAEIIRGGIQSVDPGQMEAARSLGLSYTMSMRKVVLPQAIRTMIPSIINQFIITLKDTSILSAIGFPELVNKAKNVISLTGKSLQTWAVVAVMYLIIIVLLSNIAKIVEKKMSYGRKL